MSTVRTYDVGDLVLLEVPKKKKLARSALQFHDEPTAPGQFVRHVGGHDNIGLVTSIDKAGLHVQVLWGDAEGFCAGCGHGVADCWCLK